VFVRAKYDFEATDESALSFSAGEVIEVYTKLDSGWWDGLLGSTRGWFPSNFVEPYDVREMDLGHSGQVAQEQGGQVGDENGSRDQRGVELEPGSYDGRATSSQHGEGRDSGTGDDLGWGDAMKKGGGGGWDGGGGLNELAREVMQGAGLDDAGLDDEAGAGADDFGAAAADRRRRQAQEHETMMATLGRGGDMDLADEMGPDEFGFGPRRRQREDTERTLTLRRGPVGGQEHSGEGHEGRSRRTSTSDSVVEKDGEGGEKLEESAWVPTLTDDGQVSFASSRDLTGEADE
jgi:son of sevenless-like protein